MKVYKKPAPNSSMRKLPYGRQWIDEGDIQAVTDVLRSDYLTTGPACETFERVFRDTIGAKHAIAVSSGTAGLHLAMRALNIGPDDAVIVPSITFLATANCVEYVGAKVLFSDIDPDTGLMEVDHIQEVYNNYPNENIKAIIPVHLNGQTANLEKISVFAKEHNLFVVEDACHALGTQYESSKIGDCSYCDITMFSAHPVKTIAMGEGGILTTNNDTLANVITSLRSHGMIRDPSLFENHDMAFNAEGEAHPWYYEMQNLGYNYRASDIHCALGLSQLKKLDVFLKRRLDFVNIYLSKIEGLSPHIKALRHTKHGIVGWHLFPILCDFEALNISRDVLMHALSKVGIYTQVHYIPVSRQPYYYRKYGPQDFSNATVYYNSVLALPLYPAMNEDDIDYVIYHLAQILEIKNG